jgi:hypothetical protein
MFVDGLLCCSGAECAVCAYGQSCMLALLRVEVTKTRQSPQGPRERTHTGSTHSQGTCTVQHAHTHTHTHATPTQHVQRTLTHATHTQSKHAPTAHTAHAKRQKRTCRLAWGQHPGNPLRRDKRSLKEHINTKFPHPLRLLAICFFWGGWSNWATLSI